VKSAFCLSLFVVCYRTLEKCGLFYFVLGWLETGYCSI
jgi:hypothetical protein